MRWNRANRMTITIQVAGSELREAIKQYIEKYSGKVNIPDDFTMHFPNSQEQENEEEYIEIRF